MLKVIKFSVGLDTTFVVILFYFGLLESLSSDEWSQLQRNLPDLDKETAVKCIEDVKDWLGTNGDFVGLPGRTKLVLIELLKKLGRTELDKLRQFRSAILDWDFEKTSFVLKTSASLKNSFMVQMLANRIRKA